MVLSNNLHKCIHYIKNGTFVSIIIAKAQYSLKSLIKSATGFEWQHYYVLSLNFNLLEDSFEETVDNPNIKIATEDDWTDSSLISELGVEKVNYIIERCLNSEYNCVVYKKDHVQCYGFISFKVLEFTNKFQYLLPDSEAFMYDDYCFLTSRRQGLYKKVLNERCRIIKNKGFNKVTTIVTPANKPSWNVHRNWNKDQSFYWYKFRGKEYCTLRNYDRID